LARALLWWLEQDRHRAGGKHDMFSTNHGEAHRRTHHHPNAKSTVGWNSRILLAEDNDEMRTMLASILRRDGYVVIEAKDGRELVKHLSEHGTGEASDIDLVISDIRMPGASGLDVLAGLREVDWSMPVILITAFGSVDTKSRAGVLGAAILLDKPFELEDLRHAVRSVVPPRV
jgi:DNA-binding response OmpR family regulator